MPLKSPRIPKYRHHKGSGQAFVQVKGERTYLGEYGTEESQERYRRFIAESCAAPTAPVGPRIASSPTIVGLVAAIAKRQAFVER
jgi:hypothetical protein